MDLQVVRDTKKVIKPQNNKSKIFCASLITFMKLFQIFGVNISYSNNRKTQKVVASVTKCLIIFWGILLLLSIISRFYVTVKYRENPKSMLIAIVLHLAAYLMWYHIIKYESQMIKTLNKLYKLEKLLEILPPKKLVMSCYLLFVLIFILFVCSNTYDYDISRSEKVARLWTFDSLDFHYIHTSISFIIYQITYFEWFYIYFFTCYFALLYIIISRYMTIILKEHVNINDCTVKRRLMTSTDCDSCFIRYDVIIELFDDINSIFSFPIFLESSYSYGGMLWVTLEIWKSPKDLFLNDILFLIFNFILFSATTFNASSVYEADKIAKKSNFTILRSLSNKDSKQTKESVEILSQMCLFPPFALTGWNFFQFTRGFYLTAVGCFVSYSLLIINLWDW